MNAQARLDPNWVRPYRNLMDFYLQIGRLDLAEKACRKLISLQPQNALAQIQLINIELQNFQTTESRRQYLDKVLAGQETLLPETVSELYRQMATIAFENFENDRAKRYIEFSVKRVPQNIRSYELLARIVQSDRKASATEQVWEQVSYFHGQMLANPLNAIAAYHLAINAGRAGMADMVRGWRDYAEDLRGRYAPEQTWPVGMRLELAEFLLTVGEAKEAMGVLRDLLPAVQKVQPQTRPATQTSAPASRPTSIPASAPSTRPSDSTYDEARVRMLMVLAARKTGEVATVREQQSWIDGQAQAALQARTSPPGRLALFSMYYALFSEPEGRGNPALAVKLADKASAGAPEGQASDRTVTLAMAKAGMSREVLDRIGRSGETNNPVILLAQTLALVNGKQTDAAKGVIEKALRTTPYSPLRDVMVETARSIGVTPLAADVEAIRQVYRKFSPEILKRGPAVSEWCRVNLGLRRELSRGQSPVLDLTVTNTSNFVLTAGPDGVLGAVCEVEVQPVPANGPEFRILVPLEERQLLSPKKSLKMSVLLDEAAGIDPRQTWDGFVANRDPRIKQVQVRAYLRTLVTLPYSKEIPLAQSEAITMELPPMETNAVDALVKQLGKGEVKDPWSSARLARWYLTSERFKDQHGTITAAILDRLANPENHSESAAWAWVLRSSRPDAGVFNDLARLFKSPDALTRLTALDTLGRLQGQGARKLFDFFVVQDKDELVRQLAAAYLMEQREGK